MKSSNISTVLVMLLFGLLTLAGWAMLNQSYSAPDWPERVSGLAFSPYRIHQDNISGPLPDRDDIVADLAMLAPHTDAIRTYSTLDIFFEIPQLAAEHELKVMVGAWLDSNPYTNIEELERAIALSGLDNVSSLLIGNEVLLRQELSLAELISFLDQARAASNKPVSTAETWMTWLQNPLLAEHVDFIAVHILPYWEGLDVTQAVNFTLDRMDALSQRFPDKSIVISETGWPSEGRTRQQAVASQANQAYFLRHFLQKAADQGYNYYLMEAFDQPWKRRDEGSVGAHWGIYDVERQTKFAFSGPINSLPGWQSLAILSILSGLFILCLFFLGSQTLTNRGKAMLAVTVYGVAALVCWLSSDYITMYMTPGGIISGLILLSLMLGIILLIFSETHEWVEAHWVSHRKRVLTCGQRAEQQPMVSIHVPCYNEPPAMVCKTLEALAELDYKNYEVIVVDNNTNDVKTWRPVQEYCQTLGQRFHFHHVNPLGGYKSGALNYALQNTDQQASIIAVIDSDYLVERSWLRDLVPAFADRELAIVQAPQDYRDAGQSVFKFMCNAEYQGFFEIGMLTRNERNAIIQHGTMTMIRRSVLEEVGQWAQWCITEDAELGLRIFEHGYKSLYTPVSYGRGLTPDNFLDYKKQRYRWAYGAMQILKRHSRELFVPGASRLSPGQRYHFLAGWLPWLAQSAYLIFSISSILWCIGMIVAPQSVEAPHRAFSIFPILFFGFNLLKLFHLYIARMKVHPAKALAAGIASLALSYTIGKAMLFGLFTRNQPFVRTPKLAAPRPFRQAIAAAFEESVLLLVFITVIFILLSMPHISSPDYSLWLCLLGIQCVPYAAALLTSLLSTFHINFPLPDARALANKLEVNEN